MEQIDRESNDFLNKVLRDLARKILTFRGITESGAGMEERTL